MKTSQKITGTINFTDEQVVNALSGLYDQQQLLDLLNEDINGFVTMINAKVKEFLAGTHDRYAYDAVSSLVYKLGRKAETILRTENNKEQYGQIVPQITEGLEIGTILYSSWGWEQTNIDFYCVVAKTEKMITILPMTSCYNETGFMSGKSVAGKLDFTGETKKCKIQQYIKVDSNHAGYIWNGRELYESHYA